MKEVADLAAKVKSGSGEDRELDLAIALFFDQITAEEDHSELLAYTSDLNAVFALVERELPGKQWAYHFNPGDGYICQFPPIAVAWHKDRCRALLLALLEAKNARTNP